jgi:PIN domain nuclease of toxin-antitoxin system
MIVVDSSALIAVLFEEPEKQAFQDIIDDRFVSDWNPDGDFGGLTAAIVELISI